LLTTQPKSPVKQGRNGHGVGAVLVRILPGPTSRLGPKTGPAVNDLAAVDFTVVRPKTRILTELTDNTVGGFYV
jgi:hypothetical protein